jgi:hypothetical protein
MADRGDEFRATAAQCLALAQTTTDLSTRAALISIAQRFNDHANRPMVDLDSLLQGFNDQQMAQPVAQQQTQIQPKKDE